MPNVHYNLQTFEIPLENLSIRKLRGSTLSRAEGGLEVMFVLVSVLIKFMYLCVEIRKLAVKQQHMGDRRCMSMNSKYGSLQKTDEGEI